MLAGIAVKRLGRIKANVAWAMLLLAAILSLGAWQVLASLLAYSETPSLALVALTTLARFSFMVCGTLVVVFGAIKLFAWIARHFGDLFDAQTEDEQEKGKPQDLSPMVLSQVQTVDNTLAQMQQRIRVIQERRSRAALELHTIDTLSKTLVGCVLAIAKRVTELESKANATTSLLQGVLAGDQQAMAMAAGQTGDVNLIRLVNDGNMGVYKERLVTLLSTERGGLEFEINVLTGWARDWVGQIEAFRASMQQLQLTVEMSEVLPTVVEIQGRLSASEQSLGFTWQELGVYVRARTIPRIITHAPREVQLIED